MVCACKAFEGRLCSYRIGGSSCCTEYQNLWDNCCEGGFCRQMASVNTVSLRCPLAISSIRLVCLSKVNYCSIIASFMIAGLCAVVLPRIFVRLAPADGCCSCSVFLTAGISVLRLERA